MVRRHARASALAALGIALGLGASRPAIAQRITVDLDDLRQEYVGAGSSIPLYLNNHFLLPEEGRRQALDLIVGDLELATLQDYPEFYPSDPDAAGYFERRVEYLQAALAIRPELDVSMTFSIFPDELRNDTTVGERTERRLDYLRPGIYDEVAAWYFEVLAFYKENGIDVTVVNLVNEPDFIRQRYGFGDDSRRGTAELFTQGVDKLRALIDDPAVNTAGVEQPLVMGPSTIGPGGAVQFIQYYQREFPAAWDNIDIVSYHQYQSGTGAALATIARIAEGKPIHQSEMHTNRGDGLTRIDGLEKSHRGILSLAELFAKSLNTGANAWYYFLNVFPDDDSNPGLLQVRNGFTEPRPFRQYYAFKQLTSSQPKGARVVGRELASLRDGEAVAFHEEGTDTVWVHYANYSSTAKEVVVDLAGDWMSGDGQDIEYYEGSVSDSVRNAAPLERVEILADEFTYAAPAYSLSSLKVVRTNTTSTRERGAREVPFRVERTADGFRVTPSAGQALGAIRLVDLTGRVIAEVGVGAAGGRSVNVDDLPRGIYFLAVDVADGVRTRRVLW